MIKFLNFSLFLLLSSCAAPSSAQKGFIITEYDSLGKVDGVYNVQKYELLGDKVEFLVDKDKKVVYGSFKIEKLRE